ncbi:uncharacterized protein LY79DRAFT_358303 [Colletotrichum navitas]|uniref:Uncharacterized protein n=1 Tax=Colletotrichum navitas TaxID=681940 RepID=A0AAD8V1Y6_9PEZI|nr:uncharacterized protein LY79DRAFT_358303 [Colletotrichum navitas]KAK1579188.1 hypothetical protein LY79DRAFT_358303 [Colletotrichum navitas]
MRRVSRWVRSCLFRGTVVHHESTREVTWPSRPQICATRGGGGGGTGASWTFRDWHGETGKISKRKRGGRKPNKRFRALFEHLSVLSCLLRAASGFRLAFGNKILLHGVILCPLQPPFGPALEQTLACQDFARGIRLGWEILPLTKSKNGGCWLTEVSGVSILGEA